MKLPALIACVWVSLLSPVAVAQVEGAVSNDVVADRKFEETAYRETEFDLSAFYVAWISLIEGEKLEGVRVGKPSDLATRLKDELVCGGGDYRNQGTQTEPNTNCAVLFHVYGNGAQRHVNIDPVFGLERTSIGRNAQAEPKTALVINRKQLAFIRFSDLLPKPTSKPVVLRGVPGEWSYLYSFVVGIEQNKRLDGDLNLPQQYFDGKRWKGG